MASSQPAASQPSAPRTPRNTCRLKACDQPPVSHGYCDDHLRERQPAAWTKLHQILGTTEARVYTPALRPLTRKTSRGFEVADFAAAIGEPLLPWQEWALIHALEVVPGGGYRFRTVLILVARQNGKSSLMRTMALWRMYIDGANRVLGVAQDLSLARDQLRLCIDTIQNHPELSQELGRIRGTTGDESFDAAGCTYAIKASNRRAARGSSNDLVIMDELREQTTLDGWASIAPTTAARKNGQIWCVSNQGDDNSVVLNQLHDAALSGRDPSIGVFEWSAPDNCEVSDPNAWAAANPALGTLISHSTLASFMTTDTPGVFRTEHLCQRVDQLEAAIDPQAWKDCADPAGNMDAYRGKIHLGFDIAPDEAHCTLVAAAVMPDKRIRLEAVASWPTTDDARAALPDLIKRIKPVSVGWFPSGPGAAFAPVLRPARGSAELSGGKVPEACQGLADLVKARQIVQPDDPLLNAHIAGAQKLPSGDGWRFTRKGGYGHVDGAYATAAAVYQAATQPAPTRVVFRSISV